MSAPEMVPIRRTDRAVTDEAWIEAMLTKSPFGVLATVRDGQPFANMNIFVYDAAAKYIYMHTANTGQTRSNVEHANRVCFSISEMGRLLPAVYALNFSVEYAGVIVFGTAEIVTDEAECARALQMLLTKYAPHLTPDVHYRPSTAAEIARTTVYRIRIERWSGKRKVAPDDHPGAFLYGEAAAAPWPDWREEEARRAVAAGSARD
jgi:nitroimidazol reductase NimA-like FMN-containing flavoprotein (pyridoxamine 5'-phosphate oxidase superfamily)